MGKFSDFNDCRIRSLQQYYNLHPPSGGGTISEVLLKRDQPPKFVAAGLPGGICFCIALLDPPLLPRATIASTCSALVPVLVL